MKNSDIAEQVKELIIASISSIQFIEVVDQSNESCDGGAMLAITVVSDTFNEVSAIKRNRTIHSIIQENDLMSSIHALTMNLWTPAQYETKKSKA